MISLKSSDGKIFDVEEAVAVQSNVIKTRLLLENTRNSDGKRVISPRVKSDILVKIIEYWKGRAVFQNNEEAPTAASVSEVKDLEDFDANFFKEMKRERILEISEAARYIDSRSLYDLSLQVVADMAKNNTPVQIRICNSCAEGVNRDGSEGECSC